MLGLISYEIWLTKDARTLIGLKSFPEQQPD